MQWEHFELNPEHAWQEGKVGKTETRNEEKCITKVLLLAGGKAEQAVCFPYGTTLKCRLQVLNRPASLSSEKDFT